MSTYLKNTGTGRFIRLNDSPAAVKKMVNSGFICGFEIVKATKKLRESARLNVEVKCVRMLEDGRMGYL